METTEDSLVGCSSDSLVGMHGLGHICTMRGRDRCTRHRCLGPPDLEKGMCYIHVIGRNLRQGKCTSLHTLPRSLHVTIGLFGASMHLCRQLSFRREPAHSALKYTAFAYQTLEYTTNGYTHTSSPGMPLDLDQIEWSFRSSVGMALDEIR